MGSEVLLIGAGNRMRGDDAAGVIVVTRLAHKFGNTVSVKCDMRALWDVVDGSRCPDLLVIVDAAIATDALPAGTWRSVRFPSQAELLDEQAFRNSHSLNLLSILELIQKMGTPPVEVWIYAIAGREFALGASPSLEVEAAVDGLEQQLHGYIRTWLQRRA
ncbi:MAG: hydrogenase maturation protease [Planctomycetota bacterium]|jgi:hydrogenase maturation protease